MKKDIQHTSQDVVKKAKKSFTKIFLIILGLIIVTGIAGFGYYKYSHTEKAIKAKSAREVSVLTKDIAKLMVLPVGEPTIFDITDPDKLASEQAFFSGSQKGDKLLVYSQSAKAIIYSPSRNIIVNVGPVTFDAEQKTQIKQKQAEDESAQVKTEVVETEN